MSDAAKCEDCATDHPSRWNCQREADGRVRICRGAHTRSEPCDWEPWPPPEVKHSDCEHENGWRRFDGNSASLNALRDALCALTPPTPEHPMSSSETRRCEECKRYLDGLTDDAVAHPIYSQFCVPCGDVALAEDGGWSWKDQYRREAALGINPSKKGRTTAP